MFLSCQDMVHLGIRTQEACYQQSVVSGLTFIVLMVAFAIYWICRNANGLWRSAGYGLAIGVATGSVFVAIAWAFAG